MNNLHVVFATKVNFMQKYFSVLKTMPLFKGIAESELGSLLQCLGAIASTYAKGRAIMRAGQPVSGVGVICDGTVQVIRDDITGNRSILASLGRGELFAETFACAQVDKMPVSVVAATKCVILKINYRRILTTCSSSCFFHNKMLENMLSILAHKNLALNQKNEFLSARGMREKIKAYLLAQAKRAGKPGFSIPFNRQELADYLAVERSALSRELSNMQNEGLISFHKDLFELNLQNW